MDPQLSIIIPTINEARELPQLLRSLAQQQGVATEIIVADGGSTDETLNVAKQQGIRIVESSAGRGRQMNAAATRASAPYLLFIHADSQLNSPMQLANALDSLTTASHRLGHQRIAGHFPLEFRREQGDNNLAYYYYQEKSKLNRPESTNGDQGFLLSRQFYEELGGFDESLWFLEDQRLAETIRKEGQWITLPGVLSTSARRFEEEGLGRRMILSALIMNFHHIGFIEFFDKASTIYRNQDHTGPLDMTPLFQLIQDLNHAAGGAISKRRWLATGGYVLGNAWQLFFFLDVFVGHYLRTKRRPFLSFYDRYLAGAARSRILAYPATGLTWLWFQISWKYFALRGRSSH